MTREKVLFGARVDVGKRNQVKSILGAQGRSVKEFLETCMDALIQQNGSPPRRPHCTSESKAAL